MAAVEVPHLVTLPASSWGLFNSKSTVSVGVSGLELKGVSQIELQRGSTEKYAGIFERFTRAVILGLRGTITIDYLAHRNNLTIKLLVGCISQADGTFSWSPQAQLERLRLQVSRGVQFEPADLLSHFSILDQLHTAVSVEPGMEDVGHNALRASAVLPIELSPSGIGTLAQVLEGLSSTCCVRIIIAPFLRPRPDAATLMDQLANADRLCNDSEVPRAVAYRAKGVRVALQKMMNCFLGQACVVQMQIRSRSSAEVSGILQLIREEVARPKAAEIQSIRGRVLHHVIADGDESPTISVLPPLVTIPSDQLSVAPIPSFWVSGLGEKPKHLTLVETAAMFVIPPLPEYCDVTSISSVVVETKGAAQPEKWSNPDTPIGKDALGNSISLDDDALARHVHLIGVPGSGKTTLMYQMARADLDAGRGFVVFDPHGDLAKRICYAANWGAKEIGSNFPFPGLRLLSSYKEGEAAIERDVGAILEAIESALPKEFTGPRFRQIARASLTLHAYVGVGSPISDSIKYAQDEPEWTLVRTRYNGPRWVSDFFNNHHAQRSNEKAEMVDYFASKFTDYLRTGGANMLFAPVGAGVTAQDLVERKTQLVIDFAALGTSTYDAGLLGQLFVTSFLRNITAGGPNLSRRFLLYLDEVQLFFGPAVERALQEGRKYGLTVVAAHQTSSQLSQQRFDSLVGQVGLELVFRCSLRDSQLLSEHLGLSFDSIAALPDLSCWVAGGVTVQRGGNFLLKTKWTPQVVEERDDILSSPEIPSPSVEELRMNLVMMLAQYISTRTTN
jgi:hypothetical protein